MKKSQSLPRTRLIDAISPRSSRVQVCRIQRDADRFARTSEEREAAEVCVKGRSAKKSRFLVLFYGHMIKRGQSRRTGFRATNRAFRMRQDLIYIQEKEGKEEK